jgi:hypothetical protein
MFSTNNEKCLGSGLDVDVKLQFHSLHDHLTSIISNSFMWSHLKNEVYATISSNKWH